MAIGAWFLPKNTPQDHLVPICAGLHQVQAVRSITPADALAERPPKPTLKASFPVLVCQFVRKSARPPGSSRRAGGSSAKLPPLPSAAPCLARASATAGQELPRMAILGRSVSNRLINAVQFKSHT